MYVYMLNILSKKWIASTQMFKLTAIFKTHVWKTKKTSTKKCIAYTLYNSTNISLKRGKYTRC